VNATDDSVGIQLEPVDTWFFSDGTPSPADSSGQRATGGVFPPYPGTVVGAVRAALARANDWSGRDAWPAELTAVLGDGYGPEDLGTLRFDGPYLLRCGEPVFPVPAHLLGGRGADDHWIATDALRPGSPVLCDLGEVRLPEPSPGTDATVLEPARAAWLTAAELARVVTGGLPAGPPLERTALWHDEHRVGIARDNRARTVREGMLYSAVHARLERGVSIGVRVSGLPPGWRRPDDGEAIPFGGEGRLARWRKWDGAAPSPTVPAEVGEHGRLTVIALTPLDAGTEVYRGQAAPQGLAGATLVSACLPGPQRVGGWGQVPKTGPLPLHSVLPAGSVLFCEGADADRLRKAASASDGPLRIGHRQRWGFGAVALTTWSALGPDQPASPQSSVSEVYG
jgi:CRISPR-associated protein Cmr3